MVTSPSRHLRRRSLLSSAAAIMTTMTWRGPARAQTATAASEDRGSGLTTIHLGAQPGRALLVGGSHPKTEVWGYNGLVPGPEIRVRQGDRLRVLLENRLPEDTTIHWHGLRVPNAMDGVPRLTQDPVRPGEIFAYEFDVLDAGTFWYHPHQRGFEQVGRGLYGALVVEERESAALRVDREVTWVLGDWRLLEDASIRADFGSRHDMSHAGRIGNTVTINGRVPEKPFPVRAGERIRLRLINAASARIFGLEFAGHRPVVVALDGHPVDPHAPQSGRVVLGPGMRSDLVLDMQGDPGQHFTVTDTFYPRRAYQFIEIAYADAPPLRDHPLDAPARLPANPLAEPDLGVDAARHEVTFGGGMMGNMTGAELHGEYLGMRELLRRGMAWAVNGIVVPDHNHAPMFALDRGRSCIISLRNETAWWHPIHLHGHTFRVLARNGVPARYREWQDTVLMAPREAVEIAFVADNPGDWMLHCHVLDHQIGGMTGAIRVD